MYNVCISPLKQVVMIVLRNCITAEFFGLVSDIYSAESKITELKLSSETLNLNVAKYVDWYFDGASIVD